MKFNITRHCKERYLERIWGGVKYEDRNLVFSILDDIKSAKDITDKVYREVPRVILFLLEKYHDAGQRILQKDDILFIVKKRPGTGITNAASDGLFDVFTCYNKGENYLANFKSTVLSNEEIYLRIKMVKKTIKL